MLLAKFVVGTTGDPGRQFYKQLIFCLCVYSRLPQAILALQLQNNQTTASAVIRAA